MFSIETKTKEKTEKLNRKIKIRYSNTVTVIIFFVYSLRIESSYV